MAGHSRWANIKHKKAASDAKRGRLWSKACRDVMMAARSGGNPDENARLRLAIDKAKAVNVPKDTIDRAIKKGTGELEGESYEEVTYEGYGPGGVAILCRALTDNRTRTAPEVKKIFERGGGNLGTPNCVAWMFSLKGIISIEAGKVGEERLMEVALEAGADDVVEADGGFEVTTSPAAYESVKSAIETAGIPVASSDLSMTAATPVRLDLETARKAVKLLEDLEEHDDIQSVASNLDIPEEMMREIASA
ncbi:MAG: YebC/PmpR family DNA-binding transcriptional regulator [Phycisphaerae bacterium]|nr:MAG: YebC/PmpR family DNA-binding transcriptional regulator [Planctomycetota bacterium]KAB2948740.1 MAG: YebC/PmpR family DNA-binding transcriptional regulator [Phycisphaerae bacterium]MBE7456815.1 YebC/PmpR family DNA-binding transcriptional regulator [Planctomycetia bacterium]MCK6464264.1 YebC/PmpR family DNA-binding transcriptional regulator [Phycisphaerae bacterium]MCL4717855.1 YebC/PmpR family DNA-binding transcriptional regulator [Phycisphaerae bacterium]